MSSNCPNCGGIVGLHFSTLSGCMCQYTMTKERFQTHAWKLNNVELQPKREWIGLTEEELIKIWKNTPAESEYWFEFDRAIESNLKEKNNK